MTNKPTLPFLPNSTVFAQNPKTVLKNTDIYPFLKRLSENRAKTVELGKYGRVTKSLYRAYKIGWIWRGGLTKYGSKNARDLNQQYYVETGVSILFAYKSGKNQEWWILLTVPYSIVVDAAYSVLPSTVFDTAQPFLRITIFPHFLGDFLKNGPKQLRSVVVYAQIMRRYVPM